MLDFKEVDAADVLPHSKAQGCGFPWGPRSAQQMPLGGSDTGERNPLRSVAPVLHEAERALCACSSLRRPFAWLGPTRTQLSPAFCKVLFPPLGATSDSIEYFCLAEADAPICPGTRSTDGAVRPPPAWNTLMAAGLPSLVCVSFAF